jgi:hypothetical protein
MQSTQDRRDGKDRADLGRQSTALDEVAAIPEKGDLVHSDLARGRRCGTASRPDLLSPFAKHLESGAARRPGRSPLAPQYILVLRNEITNACCGPSDDCLDVVREAIITISGVEAGHGQEMFRDMVGQIVCTHNLVAPFIERHVDVPDGPAKCLGIFRRDAMHILRSRPGQFVDLANMSRWTDQN